MTTNLGRKQFVDNSEFFGEITEEDELEILWRVQNGIDPETGLAWITPRMQRIAKSVEKAWDDN